MHHNRASSALGYLVGARARSHTPWNDKVSVEHLIDASVTRTFGVMFGHGRIDGDLLVHRHAPSEVYLVTKGLGTMEVAGRTIPMEPGRLIYLPGGVEHYTRSIEPIEFAYAFPTDSLEHVKYVFDRSIEPCSNSVHHWRLPFTARQAEFRLPTPRAARGADLSLRLLRGRGAGAFCTKRGPAVLYVTGGAGVLQIGGERRQARAGAYAFIPPHSPFFLGPGAQALVIDRI